MSFKLNFQTTIIDEKLALVVSGHPELYDFTSCNYHDLIKKQKPGDKSVRHFVAIICVCIYIYT